MGRPYWRAQLGRRPPPSSSSSSSYLHTSSFIKSVLFCDVMRTALLLVAVSAAHSFTVAGPFLHTIGGEQMDSGSHLSVINPATEEPIGKCPDACAEQ
eukprot:5167351-Prymnesium_polylepis.1